MKQTSCKRILILFINLCFIALMATAQDTSKTPIPQQKTTATPTAKTPAKPVVKAPAKPVEKPPATKKADSPAKAIVKIPAKPVDGSLKGQYDDLLRYSWMQKGYRVVNSAKLNNLWKSVIDSINNNKRQLAETKQKLDEQAKQLNAFKNQTGSANEITPRSAVKVNQIAFLGMAVDVATYNWIVWGAILALGLGLAGVLFTTTKNSQEARHHKQLHEEVSREYQSYKTKSKEKEQKLARELQTERNTIEELLSKKKDESPGKKK